MFYAVSIIVGELSMRASPISCLSHIAKKKRKGKRKGEKRWKNTSILSITPAIVIDHRCHVFVYFVQYSACHTLSIVRFEVLSRSREFSPKSYSIHRGGLAAPRTKSRISRRGGGIANLSVSPYRDLPVRDISRIRTLRDLVLSQLTHG